MRAKIRWILIMYSCSPAAAGAQSVYDLETRMVRCGIRTGDYAATADQRAAVLVFRDSANAARIRWFGSRESAELAAGNAAAGDWLTAATASVNPGRQDELAPARGDVLARLSDALARCGEVDEWLKSHKSPVPNRWVVYGAAADGPQFRAIVAYHLASGAGAISLAGEKPQQLLIQHKSYEPVLGEFLCGPVPTEGVHIVGQRGALAWNQSDDRLQLQLASDWQQLVPPGSGPFFPASRVRRRAAGPVQHVLRDEDRRAPNLAAGELDPLIVQIVVPSYGSDSYVDPLLWLLQP